MSTPLLEREEYIEQAYFFRSYRERLEDNLPSQEILSSIYEEVLATSKLTMALEFLNTADVSERTDGRALYQYR